MALLGTGTWLWFFRMESLLLFATCIALAVVLMLALRSLMGGTFNGVSATWVQVLNPEFVLVIALTGLLAAPLAVANVVLDHQPPRVKKGTVTSIQMQRTGKSLQHTRNMAQITWDDGRVTQQQVGLKKVGDAVLETRHPGALGAAWRSRVEVYEDGVIRE